MFSMENTLSPAAANACLCGQTNGNEVASGARTVFTSGEGWALT
jgi:hypothetical protein